MTLLAEIQAVLEQTYDKVGINLEECVVGPKRYRELSLFLNEERALSPRARTFLRWEGEDLAIAIYYSPDLVKQLEQEPPHRILSHRNIHALIAFVEEITHGVHVALAFHQGKCRLGSEIFYCQLELQAKIDTYWMLLRFLYLVSGGKISESAKAWIFCSLFEQESFDYPFRKLRRRYSLASQMAQCFVRKVGSLPQERRVSEIRAFRCLSFKEQYRYCFS